MSEKTKLGLGVIGTAVVLGIAGDALLRQTPWGLNFFLWVTALVAAAVGLGHYAGLRATGEGRWLFPVAVVFAAGVAWRDTPVVVALDVLVVLVAFSLAAFRGRSGSLRRAGVSDFVLGGVRAGAHAASGPLPAAIRDVRWREVGSTGWHARSLAIARGAFVAAPLLLLFGGLLAAADAAFEDLVVEAFDLDAEVLGHVFVALLVAWVAAGLLTSVLLARDPGDPEVPDRFALRRPEGFFLGSVEVFVVLYLLDALFLVFVAVQARYLFGGADRVTTVAGLTYAEYARRGFFELVAVTALILPVLLAAHWLFRPEGRSQRRTFGALCATMVALLFAIGASALLRMYLYYAEFGLTVPRLLATVFMLWLAVVFVWFALTVLRGRRDRFAFGALVTGLAVVFLMNVVSPDALVARVNIERAEDGKRFDPVYLIYGLGADAVPVLVESFPEIGDKRLDHPYTVERSVVERWKKDRNDWRSWNLSRSRAHRLVENHLAEGGG